MSTNFDYFSPVRILSGEGSIEKCAHELSRVSGKNALIVTDNTIHETGITYELMNALKKLNIGWEIFTDITGEPDSLTINNLAKMAAETRSPAIIGMGGGSVLDSAKLAAVVSEHDYAVEDFAMMKRILPVRRKHTIMIPTTSGTGAEVTSTAIFSYEQKKLWAWSPFLAPDMAVIDPIATINLPKRLTIETGLDALVHAIEAVTCSRSNYMIESFALRAISEIFQVLPYLVIDAQNRELRAKMAIAAMLAGLAIEFGGTGIAHALGHALGSVEHVRHGRAVAVSLAYTMQHSAVNAPALYLKVGRAMGLQLDEKIPAHEIAAHVSEAYLHLLKKIQFRYVFPESDVSRVDEIVSATLSEENRPMRENDSADFSQEQLKSIVNKMMIKTSTHQ